MTLPVLVLGAGPAGLAAAEALSAHGQGVTIVDDNPAPGGQLWRGGAQHWDDARAHQLWNALRARPHVRFLGGMRAVAAGEPQRLLLDGAPGPQLLDWERAVVCSGARELLLPFPGWTLPGVTGVGGLQAMVKGGVALAGKRVVVAGSGPLLLALAATLRRHGAVVVAIAEQRSTAELARFMARLALGHRAKLLQALGLRASLRGIPYLHAATLRAAHGDSRLRAVQLERGGRSTSIDCDWLACGYGLVPALETASLFDCAIEDGRVTVDAQQRSSRAGVWVAGEASGIGGVDKALAEGRIAGLAAGGFAPSARELRARAQAQQFAALLARSFAPGATLRGLCDDATIVCRCEDVRAQELAPHASWRAAKLQTRLGMGACQGRVCGTACQFLYGWEAPGLRAPIFPVSAAALAAVQDSVSSK
ncbi:MAG: FAD/NAD(P)-binding oxidoreductase [Pseudomonadota bacterium]